MSFSLVHFNEHLFLKTKNGINFDVFGRYNPPFNAAIDVNYSFSKSDDPSDTTVTIHGLTRKHAKLFTEGSTVTLWAGWCNSDCSQNNYHEIFNEKISGNINMINSGGDWQLSFDCTDGKTLAKEQSLAKMKSSNVRADASDRSGNNDAERVALKRVTDWAQHQRSLLGHQSKSLTKWFRRSEGYLTSRDHTLIQKDKNIESEEKAARAAARARFPSMRSNGKHGRDGNGSSRVNSERAHERKMASEAITRQFNALKNAIRSKKANIRMARQSNSRRRRRRAAAIRTNRQRVSRTAKRRKSKIRTRNASRREKSRRSKARRKSKSDKHKNGLHFKKNTKAETIIKSLAKRAHIKIAKIDLGHNNKKYTAGYTADKTPFQCIKDVVADCNRSIWRPHGQLYIGDFANHTPSNFILSPETGLISTPQPQNDDSNDSSLTTYQVNAIFLPAATVGWTFRIIDPESDLVAPGKEPIHRGDFFDDEVIVTDGELEVDSGSTPTASLTVVKKKDQAKAESAKIKSKSRKIKAHKDARDRHKTKARRAKRQRSRRR